MIKLTGKTSNTVTSVKVYSDGGCRGNPGNGAIGGLILDQSNKPLEEYKEYIGHCTNNQAEYKALIKGLDLAAKHCRNEVYCYTDSELVVKQLKGIYRLKNDTLRNLYHEVKDKERPFKRVVYSYMSDKDQRIQKAHNLAHDVLKRK